MFKVEHLKMYFPTKAGVVKAIDDISFTIQPGETLGLVGESGCGKSTTGRSLLRLIEPSSGSVWYEGKNILQLPAKELKALRRELQIIFQDPYSSLNPRMTVEEIIGEPLTIHKLASGKARVQRIEELLVQVGLSPEMRGRFPHEFSGGQRQRLGIARALAVDPRFIVCDEPIAALDVSIQAQIINLLKKLQQERGLTFLFIAHDLSMVKYLSDRVVVMYLGQIVELAAAEELYDNPLHPYTQALLSSIPLPNPQMERTRTRVFIKGEIPSPLHVPSGCPFASRCPHATSLCLSHRPVWKEVAPNHFAACHLL